HHRLVLLAVVLQRQALPGVDVEDLADVAVGVGPDELVPPRLVDAPHARRFPRNRKRSALSMNACDLSLYGYHHRSRRGAMRSALTWRAWHSARSPSAEWVTPMPDCFTPPHGVSGAA